MTRIIRWPFFFYINLQQLVLCIPGWRYDASYQRCLVRCCKGSGLLITVVADRQVCDSKAVPSDNEKTTTMAPTPAPAPTCNIYGRKYLPGAVISRSKAYYIRSYRGVVLVCSLYYCDGNCAVRYIRNAENCEVPTSTAVTTTPTTLFDETTVIPETTTPPVTTTAESTTPPFGCVVNDQVYLPGEEISRHEVKRVDACYGRFCNESGEIERWENDNCFTYRMNATKKEVGEEGCTVNGEYYPVHALVPIENSPDDCLISVCEPGYSSDGLVYWNTCEEEDWMTVENTTKHDTL